MHKHFVTTGDVDYSVILLPRKRQPNSAERGGVLKVYQSEAKQEGMRAPCTLRWANDLVAAPTHTQKEHSPLRYDTTVIVPSARSRQSVPTLVPNTIKGVVDV